MHQIQAIMQISPLIEDGQIYIYHRRKYKTPDYAGVLSNHKNLRLLFVIADGRTFSLQLIADSEFNGTALRNNYGIKSLWVASRTRLGSHYQERSKTSKFYAFAVCKLL